MAAWGPFSWDSIRCCPALGYKAGHLCPGSLFIEKKDKAMAQESGLLTCGLMIPPVLQLQLRPLQCNSPSHRPSPMPGSDIGIVFHKETGFMRFGIQPFSGLMLNFLSRWIFMQLVLLPEPHFQPGFLCWDLCIKTMPSAQFLQDRGTFLLLCPPLTWV